MSNRIKLNLYGFEMSTIHNGDINVPSYPRLSFKLGAILNHFLNNDPL